MQFHWFYIVGLLVIVLIIFGPGRLPELGGAVGKAMKEFRKATSELTNEVTSVTHSTQPAPPSNTTPPAAPPTTPESSAATGSQSEATSPKI